MSRRPELATLNLSVKDGPEHQQPLFRRLSDQIRQQIQQGQLSAGAKLPSSRQLAQQLSISRTACLNAYEQLVAEGYLISRPASGMYVSGLAENRPQQTSALDSTSPENPLAGNPQRAVFDTGPDVELFPFADWARSSARVWRQADVALLRNFPDGGYPGLQQAICQYLKGLRGIDCSPQQVIITAGSRDAVALVNAVLDGLIGQDAEVALEKPCYPALAKGFKHRPIHYCDVDDQGAQLPHHDQKQYQQKRHQHQKPDLAWLTPGRQYPLAIPMSMERRLQWLNYARENNTLLVEDDYDSEFHFHKTPLVSLFSLSQQLSTQNPEQQRVIWAGSFTKVMFRTLRIGYLVVPHSLIVAFHQAQKKMGNVASLPIQPALADFLQHRRFASHMRRMKRIYQQRRDFLYSLVKQELAEFGDCTLPENGLHLLFQFYPEVSVSQPDFSDLNLQQQLAKQNIQALPLSDCYPDNIKTKPQGLILGYSGAPEAELAAGVQQLVQLLQQHKQ